MKRAILGGLTCVVWLFFTAIAYAHNYPDTILDAYASEGAFEVSAYGDTWKISPADLGEFLTGEPEEDSSVKIPAGDYIVLGFEDKTIIDGPGDDFTVHAASRVGAVDVYGFVNAFDWDMLIHLGEATETTAFDFASVGLDKGDRLVAVKIEGNDGFASRLSFELHAIEIASDSVGGMTSEPGGITGAVSDAVTELPLSNVEVSLYDATFTELIGIITTPDSGYFEFLDLSSGKYNLRFLLGGYDEQEHNVLLEPGESLSLDIALDPEIVDGSAQITVVDSVTGQAISGADVFLIDAASGNAITPTISDLGIYVFEEISPGTYRLTVAAEGYVEQAIDLDISSGERLIREVVLEEMEITGTIHGTISDESGKPLSGAMVVLKEADGSHQQMRSSEEGIFVFTDLDSGDVEIQATLSGYITQSKSLKIEIGDDRVVEFLLQKEVTQGTIMGTVMDGNTGKPVENALILIGDGELSATTSELGQYLIRDIPAGSLTLKVFKVGYREVTQTVELNSESILRINLKLFLKGNVSINGRIIDSMGFNPVNGATIQISNADGFDETRDTSIDGLFSFSSLTPGKYVVEIEASGFKSRRRDVLIDGDTHQSVMIKLVPKAPEIISSGLFPNVIFSGVSEKVTFYVTVQDPDGVDDISGVFLSHPSLSTSLLGNEFIDGIEMAPVDRENETVRYEYQTSLLGRLPPREYLMNVRVEDELGFQADETLKFSVIQRNQFRLLKQQINQTTLNNTLDKQSLVISVVLTGDDLLRANIKNQLEKERDPRAVDPADIECPECYVEVRIYRPDGTLYNEPYIVCDSKDITISGAEAGEWTYETTSYCPTSLDIKVETRGAGTAFLTGLVKDGDTGQAIPEARVQWSLGGETFSSETGYFSTIVLPGEGLVTTTSSNYKINLKGNVVLTSTERKRIDITLLPEAPSLLPPPDQPIISEISDPQPYPDPYIQPFAAGEIDSNFVISARFPAYQSDVSIYLGISSDAPELAPYFLLYNAKDELIVMEDLLVPWRDETVCCQWQQADPLLSFPVEMLPPGRYTFYSLVTTDPQSLETYDLRYFTLDFSSGDGVQQ